MAGCSSYPSTSNSYWGFPRSTPDSSWFQGLIGTIVAGLVIVPIARRFRPSLLTPIGLLISSAGYAGNVLSGGQISAAGIALTFSAIALGIGAGFVLLAAVVGASMLRNAR